MEKYQYFNNLKFTLDEHSHYYLNSTIRKRLHRYVWEYYNGPIPKGYEIHHIDFDKANNDISNLRCLSRSEHRKLHADLLTDEQRDWKRNNLNITARPKAIEWHKSKDGREWHSKHAKEQYRPKITCTCISCGTKFIGDPKSKYCSNVCKSRYRRSLGTDQTTKVCAFCGKEFKTNKYRPAITCSRSCANRYRCQHESKISKKN